MSGAITKTHTDMLRAQFDAWVEATKAQYHNRNNSLLDYPVIDIPDFLMVAYLKFHFNRYENQPAMIHSYNRIKVLHFNAFIDEITENGTLDSIIFSDQDAFTMAEPCPNCMQFFTVVHEFNEHIAKCTSNEDPRNIEAIVENAHPVDIAAATGYGWSVQPPENI